MSEQESIFDFTDYKLYLKAKIESLPRRGRGIRAQLAKALRCQTAYVSQVLNGNSHLSLEQGLVVNQFLGHLEQESQVLFLLIQYARAGTQELKDFFLKQIHEAQAKHLLVRERFKTPSSLTAEDKVNYYSAWHLVVIHILSSIPSFQSPLSISRALNLSLEVVNSAFEFLSRCGLVVPEDGKYRIGSTRIHLGNDSPLISKHHMNWRLQAIRSLERPTDKDLHYSSVVSLSATDVPKIRKMMIDTLEKFNETVARSPEEECHCLNLDFFNVVGNSPPT